MLKILRDSELQRIKSTPVLEVTTELKRLAAEMMATMQLANGVGLAAPQINRYISLIVFDVVNHTYNAMDSGYLFNPEVINQSIETEVDKEGCLSFVGEYHKVSRPKWIKVKYLNLANQEVIHTYTGLAARVICHEIQHLEGITFRDVSED